MIPKKRSDLRIFPQTNEISGNLWSNNYLMFLYAWDSVCEHMHGSSHSTIISSNPPVNGWMVKNAATQLIINDLYQHLRHSLGAPGNSTYKHRKTNKD